MPSAKEQVELLMRGTKFADESAEYGDPDGDSNLRRIAARELENRIEKAAKESRPLRVYLGVDPTRDSLHIGHMVPAQKLRQFQQLGHRAIFLIGDYTARIGDPSGRSKERPFIPGEEIDRMAKLYGDQAFKLLDREKTEIRYNSEWLADMNFESLIKIAAIFPVKQMIARRDFQNRMEAGEEFRFHEMLYALMQGYDAYMLKCDVQIGAYDQHFNLLAGRAIQEHYGDAPHIMLTMPLLAGTDGRKMSKSAGNTIDLMDTPEDMYGKCMRISDDLLPHYIELAANFPAEEKDALRARLDGAENPMNVKKEVAFNVTAQYNGTDAAQRAAEHFKAAVQEKSADADAPEIKVGSEYLSGEKTLFEFIIENRLFDGSNRDLRRLFEQGGVKVDERSIADPKAAFDFSLPLILKIGKRAYTKLY